MSEEVIQDIENDKLSNYIMKKTIFIFLLLSSFSVSFCNAEIYNLVSSDADTISSIEIINKIKKASYEDVINCEKCFISGHLDLKKSGIDTVKCKLNFHLSTFFELINLRGNFYSECDLGETRFESNADLRYAEFFEEAKIKLDNMTYDKFLIRWEQICDKIYFSNTLSQDQSIIGKRNTLPENCVDIAEVISVYNALEKNFRNIGRYSDEDACYYRKKKIEQNDLKKQLKGKWWPIQQFWKKLTSTFWPYMQSLLFDITCKYGTKPINILKYYIGVVSFMTIFCYGYDSLNTKKKIKNRESYFPYKPSFINSLIYNLYLPITLAFGIKFSFSNNRLFLLLFILEGIAQWILITLLIICLSIRLI